ncbi:hypothetical protein Cni_G02491 [Canna indica]|uniref:Uncharacterized protein n=1 Tax=Canna indica TaxID=4628 RepID=A0AAQ3Q282_9LILI|nr:hypothetical protein Cni_G02491 [Canna indica]
MGVPKVLADLRLLVGNIEPDRPVVGILAFEAATVMSRLVCLHRSLAEEEVRRLRTDMRSQGVGYLTSKDQSFLLRLACAEQLAELDKSVVAISCLGPKCDDPLLRGFHRFYAELKAGGWCGFLRGGGGTGDLDHLGLGTTAKTVEKRIKKMENYVEATSRLYAELEALNELEASERRMEQYRRHSGPIPMQKPPATPAQVDSVQIELRSRRQKVRHLKEESLWNKTYDKAVEVMVRAVITVFARICVVFGPYVLMHWGKPDKYNSGKYTSGPLERLPVAKNAAFLNNSAPIFIVKDEPDTPFESLSKLMEAGPSTVGGSGLALRYANMVVLARRLLKMRSSAPGDAESEEEEEAATREELYEMMPAGIRGAVRTKLREWWRREGGTTVDGSLAEGWREAVAAILAWLGPVADDTLRWQDERNMERQQRFYMQPRALLLQTLHFADLEKTEAAVVEVLVGLSCMLWYEERRRESHSSSN